ncbi:MAG: diguanylate cyclase [Myxococcota bacterium]|nr:diguanylate cyclase [Myxococcota bacterium]
MPPHVIARVIQVAADPDSTVGELADIIKMDAVLSAQILKSVNSPYYSLRRKLSSVERAISFMGIRAVRNLVLCLGVQGLAPDKSDYPIQLFWESSLRRAVAAKCLARKLKLPDEEEIFTLGLCQDMGVLLLVRQSPVENVSAFTDVARESAKIRIETERQWGKCHDEISAALFESWKFPPEVVAPVRWHHEPENAPEEHIKRTQVASSAEAIADLLEVEDKQNALKTAASCIKALGLDTESLGEIMDEVSESVTEAAQMLEIKVGPQPSYQEIAQQASQGLLALNMSYQSLTKELQDSLDEQQRMAARLKELNQDLEKRALTDDLTGLPNRRAFDEGLTREIERAKRLNAPLSLMMLDVDFFKKFNDTHGHQVGDLVLKGVGKTIQENARSCDLPARYGGEEFAIILPHTNLEGALIAAERVRAAVETLCIETDKARLKVTISIGVATTKDPNESRANIMLLRRADDALYEAKEAGRNCVKGS